MQSLGFERFPVQKFGMQNVLCIRFAAHGAANGIVEDEDDDHENGDGDDDDTSTMYVNERMNERSHR